MDTDKLDCLLLEYARRGDRSIPPGYEKELVMERRAEFLRLGYGIGGAQRAKDKSAKDPELDSLTEAGEMYYAQHCRGGRA